jgi:hypothetical protein
LNSGGLKRKHEFKLLIISPVGETFIFVFETKTKQKIQGSFLSSPIIFTKPNFKGVISSHARNFSFSLRFCFDSGIDKNRPQECKFGEFKILMKSGYARWPEKNAGRGWREPSRNFGIRLK